MERWLGLGVIANNLLVLARADRAERSRSTSRDEVRESTEKLSKSSGRSFAPKPLSDLMLVQKVTFAPVFHPTPPIDLSLSCRIGYAS